MKTMTVTLAVTEGVEQPQMEGGAPAAFAGFKLTLTAASGNAASPDVSMDTVWVFQGLPPGASYMLLVQGVDVTGRVIQSMEPVQIKVPVEAVATYTRVDGIGIAFSD